MPTHLYFDYCSTTPLHPQVKQAMLAGLEDSFGNPSSMHSYGRKARQLVENAREQVGAGIGALPSEIIFTSGATESNNLALIGTLNQLAPGKTHLITSAIEHHAVLHSAEALERAGFQLTILSVDSDGFISPKELEDSIRSDTALISIMLVNNEIGTLQDIQELSKIAEQHGIIFHTDAVQAAPCLEIDVNQLGVDLLSLSGHKIYGPKGIGALYIRSGREIQPLLSGGAQEKKLRPGTENVPGILGLGSAMALRADQLENRNKHFTDLRNYLLRGLADLDTPIKINGPQNKISPHVVSASFHGVDGEMMLFLLNQEGVAVSLGSACTSEDLEPSHVLTALGLPPTDIESTLRISLGEPTTKSEIDQLMSLLPAVIDRSRAG
jgi:cysteine desulfurase